MPFLPRSDGEYYLDDLEDEIDKHHNYGFIVNLKQLCRIFYLRRMMYLWCPNCDDNSQTQETGCLMIEIEDKKEQNYIKKLVKKNDIEGLRNKALQLILLNK